MSDKQPNKPDQNPLSLQRFHDLSYVMMRPIAWFKNEFIAKVGKCIIYQSYTFQNQM